MLLQTHFDIIRVPPGYVNVGISTVILHFMGTDSCLISEFCMYYVTDIHKFVNYIVYYTINFIANATSHIINTVHTL